MSDESQHAQEIVAQATETAAKVVHDAKNTAHEVLVAAQAAAEAANTDPTNAQLKQSFDEHAAQDKIFQDSQDKVNAATLKSLASIHERLGTLATTEDVQNVQSFLKSVSIGAGIIRFSWRNASQLGSFALFLLAIYEVFKLGVIGAVGLFIGRGF